MNSGPKRRRGRITRNHGNAYRGVDEWWQRIEARNFLTPFPALIHGAKAIERADTRVLVLTTRSHENNKRTKRRNIREVGRPHRAASDRMNMLKYC